MRSFWWFEEGLIAGMARPGFNCTPWFELEFDEASLMGWLGLHSSGQLPRLAFHKHLKEYAPKIAKFYFMNESVVEETCGLLKQKEGLNMTLNKIAERTQWLESFEVSDDFIHFNFNQKRLQYEVSTLKEKGIKKIVSLTEDHHSDDVLADHFELHHFSITDLNAPSVKQVRELAEIFDEAENKKEAVGVHCLAGIGRTSTMIMASNMFRGDSKETVVQKISEKNPIFKLTGPQKDFIDSLSTN